MAADLSFLIALKEQISGPAKAGQSALAALEAQIRKEGSALKTLEDAMKRVQSNGSVDIAQYKKLQGAIDQKKASLAGLTDKLTDVGAGGGEAAGGVEELGTVLGELGGPIGIAIAVLTAVLAVIGAVVAKVAELTLVNSDARRSFMIVAEEATGTAAGAKDLSAQIDALRGKTTLGRQALEQLGVSLANAGLKGEQLKETLAALAAVETVRGTEASKKLQEIVEKAGAGGSFKVTSEQLAKTGLSIQELYKQIADRMHVGIDKVEGLMKAGKVSVADGVAALNAAIQNGRIGKASADLAMGMSAQWQKLKDDIASIFSQVDVGPFLAALKSLLSIFDQNTASGRVFAAIAKAVGSALVQLGTWALPLVKAALVTFMIWSLKAYIALKQFADSPAGKTLIAMLEVMGVAFLTIAAIIAAVFLAPLLLVVGIVYAVGAAIDATSDAWSAGWDIITGALEAAVDWISSISLTDIAGGLIDGLVDGISAGAGAVVDAITGVVGGAIDAAKSLLGIASPSKVFAQLGLHTAAGFGEGLDAGGDTHVAPSIASMVGAPSAAASKGGGGRAIHIEINAPITVQGGAGAVSDVEAQFMAMLERVGAQLGAQLEANP